MDYVRAATKYADNVLSGKIEACSYVRLACERFFKDLEKLDRGPWDFDWKEAGRACRFLEQLPHVKGRWAARRQKLKLSPWQVFITVNIFGWRDKKTRYRRFREAYIEVPRKNGKSLFAAGIGLYMLCCDSEFGAEIYSGATTEKQAWEVFRPAKQICERVPALRERFGIEVNAKSLVIMAEGSRFEPVIGNPGDGSSPSCAIVDEFHEHKNSDLVDTMSTGMGAREQPLLFVITTSGSDFGGPCREKREDVIRVLEGTVKDDTVFAIIFTLDEGDRWDTIAALKKANPNFGISVNEGYLKAELAKARRSATKQNAFKTKHLNLWVGAKTSWMNMLAFQRCKRVKVKMSDFKGGECFVGIDLASKIDVASAAFVFKPDDKVFAFYKHYLPEEAVYEGRNDRYKAWAETGWLITTPGPRIDFDQIEDDLIGIASEYDVREVAFDPHQATQFVTHMMAEGFTMVEVRPTVLNFSEPMKELEALILNRQFIYNGDPVFTWMMGNVIAKLDKKDNIYPNRERVQNKIDGVVATIMAVKRLIAQREPEQPTVVVV